MVSLANSYLEEQSSKIPAIKLLQALGYTYLTREEAMNLRGNSLSNCLLEPILIAQLKKMNFVTYKGQRHEFTDANIKNAVQSLRIPFDTLMKNNEQIYDLLNFGRSFEQTIEGNKKSYSLTFIDWATPENNVFHVVEEFSVEKLNSKDTLRPDLVLFVNGIPLVVIECKRPDLKGGVQEAISQHLRNQKTDGIPELYTFSQILLAFNTREAMYGTTDTSLKYWATWKEENLENGALSKLINQNSDETRLTTAQDECIYALLRKERLLDLIANFTLFDNKEKKITRYQQFFAIKAAVSRATKARGDTKRQGGVIWHTTGSGKSLTMVMLAKALALHPLIPNAKIVLVTDRVDLDDQIYATFTACGKLAKQASSGENLYELVRDNKANIITTIIDKFKIASKNKAFKDEGTNIFVLIDESHRSQYGVSNATMEMVFPNACYIGFTGTPLLKKEKTTAQKFGGFIHKYTMNQAVQDGAVAPLIYEGRMSELHGSKSELDRWFERITQNLSPEQKRDLKRKFQREAELNKSHARIAEIAYDISEHFKQNFRGTGKKGQLAVSSKEMALVYRKNLSEYGIEVDTVMSSPDMREDNSSTDESQIPEVQVFWKAMMAKYGNEADYNKQIIERFKKSETPEILIVVDKLLTGFDAPCNSVLYIDKPLKEHNILQAIARVNRLFDNKDYGLIVDYRGIFGELNEAIDTYKALEKEGFDLDDIVGTLIDISERIKSLPQLHSDVWQIFASIKNKSDKEALERFLELQDKRDEFYERLRAFASCLQLALSNTKFITEVNDKLKARYKEDLKFFLNLRSSIKLRYNEVVDYGAYEAQIRSLVNNYIGADAVKQLIKPVDIFDKDAEGLEIEALESDAAKADAIASRMRKTIIEKMDEDPLLYKRLSEVIEGAIADHRADRLSDANYLEKMRQAKTEISDSDYSHLPLALRDYYDARIYYGIADNALPFESLIRKRQDILADIAIRTEELIEKHKIRDWAQLPDIQNLMRNDIEDVLYSIKGRYNLNFGSSEIDLYMEQILTIAKKRG